MAGILGGNIACGHVQMICPSCLHVGCEEIGCQHSANIPGSRCICARCGDNKVIYMNTYKQRQRRAEEDKREEVRAQQEEIDTLKSDLQDTIDDVRRTSRGTTGARSTRRGNGLFKKIYKALKIVLMPQLLVLYAIAWVIRYSEILPEVAPTTLPTFMLYIVTYLLYLLSMIGELIFHSVIGIGNIILDIITKLVT